MTRRGTEYCGLFLCAIGWLVGGCEESVKGPSVCQGKTNLDIEGTFTERYNCEMGGDCVDQDVTFIVELEETRENADGSVSFSFHDLSEFDWSGEGTLCGNLFTWNATAPGLTESGAWDYSDADNFEKASSFDTAAGHGTCTGMGARSGTPPAPPPVGDCP